MSELISDLVSELMSELVCVCVCVCVYLLVNAPPGVAQLICVKRESQPSVTIPKDRLFCSWRSTHTLDVCECENKRPPGGTFGFSRDP